MLSLKYILPVLLIAVAAVLILRSNRKGELLAPSAHSQQPNADTDENVLGQCNSSTDHPDNMAVNVASIRNSNIPEPPSGQIVINANRTIEPELAAELDHADEQIRQAATRSSVALPPAKTASRATPNFPTEASISDAELIEEELPDTSQQVALPDSGEIIEGHVLAVQPELTRSADFTEPTSASGVLQQTSTAREETALEAPSVTPAIDSHPDNPTANAENKRVWTDLAEMQVESNSAQLMLVDNYLEMLLGADNLRHTVQRLSEQSETVRHSHSHINAEQQRKLITTNARASRLRSEVESERQARQSAEQTIATQQDKITQIEQELAVIKATLSERQNRLIDQEQQLAKSKMMARSAAKLARRAAITQQQARHLAENEKKLRHRTESRTQKAISIAKNAISALAEKERESREKTVPK